MNKIVELVINFDEFEFDDLGASIISLVDHPAIEVNWLAFKKEEEDWYVDNSGMEKFKTFLDENQDMMKKPGGGPAGDGGVDHGAQMKLLEAAGVNTEYPFGYCFQIAQFVFYALGGYNSEWDLKCIKKMEYKVDGHDFQSTHWYVQSKEDGRIIDLSAEQFDGILKIEDYYSQGRRANLGFPYYNVEDKVVEFDETVPSLMTLKLYSKWKEENGELEGIEPYYQAAKYEEVRMASMEFSEEKLPYNYKEVTEHILSVASDPNVGIEIDPEEVVYLDMSKSEFATLGEILQGINMLDALSNIPLDTEGQEMFRYTGPSAQRFFCKTLKALNKVYTRGEIAMMNGLNSSFGPGPGGGNYSVFDFKGGVNCRHYWERVFRYSKDGRNVIVSLGPAEDEAGLTNNRNYQSPNGYVPDNASLKFWAFGADDKQIITGPAMIPQQLILRKDEMGNPFFVYFTTETIEKIARKFLADNNTHNTDINHNEEVSTENTLLESWIVEDPERDKASVLGFDVPKGTWMVSYKINNPETWQKIKAGELNGFSITGQFIEKLQNG